MMWIEADHPRDPSNGRFIDAAGRLPGVKGRFDRLAARLRGEDYARAHAEYEREWDVHEAFRARVYDQGGTVTAEEDRRWDLAWERMNALREKFPSLSSRQPPLDSIGVRVDKVGRFYDEEGRQIPKAAILGYTRIGDSPEDTGVARWFAGRDKQTGQPIYRERFTAAGRHPAANGVWHKPGDYYPGGVPALYNDDGIPHGEQAVREILGVTGKARSRQLRDIAGAFSRAEDRAERVADRTTVNARSGRKFERSSADVVGAELINALNPVSRRRTARQQRNRQQNVTWVQRLNDRMEYGRG